MTTMNKDQALENLEREIIAAESWERDTSQRHAGVVGATAICLRSGCTRAEIATRLKKHSKSSLPRYVLLAREENERKAGPVMIEGTSYASPVEALRSRVTSYRQVYQAFRDALNPRPARAYPSDAVQASHDAVISMKIRLATGLVRVAEHLPAWAGAMAGLLNCPVAQQIMSDRERKRIHDVMAKAMKEQDTAQAA